VINPIQQIKAGIQAGDWTLVCIGYQSMTGEGLTPPAGGTANDAKWANRLLTLITEMSGELPKEEPVVVAKKSKRQPNRKKLQPAGSEPEPKLAAPESPDVIISTPPTPKGIKGEREARSEPFQAPKGNRFVDDPKLFANEAKLDALMTKGVEPAAPRAKVEMLEAVCVCGKKEKVHPIFLEGAESQKTYKCQKCILSQKVCD